MTLVTALFLGLYLMAAIAALRRAPTRATTVAVLATAGAALCFLPFTGTALALAAGLAAVIHVQRWLSPRAAARHARAMLRAVVHGQATQPAASGGAGSPKLIIVRQIEIQGDQDASSADRRDDSSLERVVD